MKQKKGNNIFILLTFLLILTGIILYLFLGKSSENLIITKTSKLPRRLPTRMLKKSSIKKTFTDKDKAFNTVKLYESLMKKPGNFRMSKAVRNQFDKNSKVLQETKGGAKVISINGKVY